MDNRDIKNALGVISRLSGLGDPKTTLQNLFYGINHRGFGNPVPSNTDQYGYTFFTRPRLNLSYHNVLGVRKFHPLLNNDDSSVSKAIRAYLDPISNRGLVYEELGVDLTRFQNALAEGGPNQFNRYDIVKTPMVDEYNSFIPLLTNNLVSLSGWPDLVGDTFTSVEGMAREAYSILDGIGYIYSTFDITANFQNVAMDPITLLLDTWLSYGLHVRQGEMIPWPSSIIEREIDYTSRMFRIVVDSTRTRVKKIASTICFPTNSTLGQSFNFNRNIPTIEENRDVSQTFRCMGAEYNDPILVYEFNRFVQDANPAMRPSRPRDRDDLNPPPIGLANGTYSIITPRDKEFMNYRGYPQINPDTMDLTWYAPNEEWGTTL